MTYFSNVEDKCICLMLVIVLINQNTNYTCSSMWNPRTHDHQALSPIRVMWPTRGMCNPRANIHQALSPIRVMWPTWGMCNPQARIHQVMSPIQALPPIRVSWRKHPNPIAKRYHRVLHDDFSDVFGNGRDKAHLDLTLTRKKEQVLWLYIVCLASFILFIHVTNFTCMTSTRNKEQVLSYKLYALRLLFCLFMSQMLLLWRR